MIRTIFVEFMQLSVPAVGPVGHLPSICLHGKLTTRIEPESKTPLYGSKPPPGTKRQKSNTNTRQATSI